jgi:peptidoglycan/LPS O-acetylase OafA/YrhL
LPQAVALLGGAFGPIGFADSSTLAAQSGFPMLLRMVQHSRSRDSTKIFGYQPALDGVRAVAVLLVMAGHLNLVYAGGLGVDIFFVLSGYLITAILVSEFSANGRISLKKFYARRALRILPAVILLLLVLNVFVAITQPPDEAATLRWDSLGSLFYIANWLRAFGRDLGILGHLWSLSIEEQFYFFWPITLAFLLSRTLSTNKIILLIGGAVLLVNADRIYLYHGIESFNRIYNGLDARADALLIGCALGLSGYQILSRRVFALLGLIGAAFVGYVLFRSYPVPANLQVPFGLTVGGTLFALGVAFSLAAILSNPQTIFAKSLRLPPMVWTGRLSYGLYLWHYPVFTFVGGWLPGLTPVRSTALKVCGTFLAATLSYYILERPCLNLKKKFSVINTRVPTSPSPVESVGY